MCKEDPASGAVVVFRDISELRRHEQGREGAREQAEAADLVKGLFLASMSHELRTPQRHSRQRP